MMKKKLYIEKELSWLSFNERVLQEVADRDNSLAERMRFLSIYYSNLDEFYQVRFANLKHRILRKEVTGICKTSSYMLKTIQDKVIYAENKLNYLYNELLSEITIQNDISLINETQLSPIDQNWLRNYFKQNLRPYIKPIIIQNNTNLMLILKDNCTYLVVEIIQGLNISYALLEIPSFKAKRLIPIPDSSNRLNVKIILLDNILRYCLDDIFAVLFDYDKLNAYSMQITRDSQCNILNQAQYSLLELISLRIKHRQISSPVCLIYQTDMPNHMVEMLKNKLGMSSYDSFIPSWHHHYLKEFMILHFVSNNNYYINKYKQQYVRSTRLDQSRNVFEVIRTQDILLYFPYHTFNHMLELLRQASFDKNVLLIKISIYRVAKHSHIIDAMIHAAYNGKKVTVVIELQARFDEEANICWAKQLTEAGVQVIFSIPGLKIHAKLFLISRREGTKIVYYAHIGTGNFNEKTASLYTDYSLITSDTRITKDVRQVFNFIENPYRPVHFDYLMVSPQNARQILYQTIDQEMVNAQAGKKAGITLKLNHLVDKGLIDRLYVASSNGVKINILVRGMCSLIPEIPGISDNIRVISIIDKYLEHDRVYVFENGGDQTVFLSSADWMQRNIDDRIEVAVPLLDQRLKKQVLDILSLLFSDTVKARSINANLSNSYVKRGNPSPIRAQIAVYNYIKQLEQTKLHSYKK
ncbi:polyphosphate kinase 1 [Candidatus Palibaumannia cicadellinicola]|uniref:Polyphosphate kinase n=1 Tax=Baumannia cicadellinicola subsp. Homalodisca coagulata TaxID=374463 RepID=Q1LU12_BAUCH|nr:polyphosphate kinase 1 [Candidatus Baumannia cicadellinicola]ABF13933.1 polyphosphate kinase [Baumannia cicadellinicola str. Hc (Homalodisca coagulata)]MBS0032610.1 polyphosphate kinase 1 [Candidatus Baumannia cicadellinicola]MCJ7462465.1 polyphosphate kinase 1 [Candidatus Baumannia cicadellinicola]MCJ7462658.1 polyphosphate kinase 1 [Candidatus Baumannia cicadellinicola]